MNLVEAKQLIRDEMVRHGLQGWTMVFSTRMTSTHGSCSYRTFTLKFNTRYVELNDRDNVHQTILHEIAHALVSRRNGHNKVWRTKALELGVKDPSPYNRDAVAIPSKWITRCPNGHFGDANRRGVRSCGRCDPKWNPEYKLSYIERSKV